MTADVPTLLLVIVLVCLTLGLSILAVEWRRKAYPGLALLGWSLLMLAVAIAAFGLRILDWQVTSVLLANGLTSVVLALHLLSVRQFQRARFDGLTLWLVWLPVPAGFLIALLLVASPQWRTLILALLWCFQSILLTREVARPAFRGEMERGRILLLSGCVIVLLLFVLRAVLSAVNTDWSTPLSIPEPILTTTYLISLCVILLNTMGYVLMQMEWAIEEQHRQSLEDPLTGVANRRALVARLESTISLAKRNGSPVSALMIDIDRFKRVNDTYGHKTGDVVLVEIVRRIADRLRGHDFLARFGGEEFVVLLPDTDANGGAVVAEDIRRAVENLPVTTNAHSIPVTVSVGVGSCIPSGTDNADDGLMIACDNAMYLAKKNGRNRVEVGGAPD